MGENIAENSIFSRKNKSVQSPLFSARPRRIIHMILNFHHHFRIGKNGDNYERNVIPSFLTQPLPLPLRLMIKKTMHPHSGDFFSIFLSMWKKGIP